MSSQLLAGYVLHQRPFRDQSQLLEVFTAERGRQGAIGRRSKRRSLRPLQPLWLELGGRGELQTIRNWEPRGRPPWLSGPALLCGLYLNELLYRLVHRDDPQPELFAGYEAALDELARLTLELPHARTGNGADLELLLRRFELLLLETLGYALDLEVDAQGSLVSAQLHYRFEAGIGLVPASGHGSLAGRDLLDYRAGIHSAGARKALKQLCRLALAPHLGGKPLLSRQLFPRGN